MVLSINPMFLFRLKPENLEKELDKYSESARMKRGEKIGLPEFAAYLEVPVSDALEDMFSLFDEVGPLGSLGQNLWLVHM